MFFNNLFLKPEFNDMNNTTNAFALEKFEEFNFKAINTSLFLLYYVLVY